ncbi:hypothetical protein J6590_010584 [Homalodisca vitripennis]|nr:hypothetical protein J6590_010584 [Homalodisca vitripennis]
MDGCEDYERKDNDDSLQVFLGCSALYNDPMWQLKIASVATSTIESDHQSTVWKPGYLTSGNAAPLLAYGRNIWEPVWAKNSPPNIQVATSV